MATFTETKSAGMRFENEVSSIIERHATRVYHSLRVPTLYTENGTTEIDLLAAINDVVLVFEVKNVQRIEGTVFDSFWTMMGANTGEVYNALNVFTQNRIHVRALKARWFELHKEFPIVLPVVVVPNECVITDGLAAHGIIQIGDLDLQLSQLSEAPVYKKECCYSLDFLVSYISQRAGDLSK